VKNGIYSPRALEEVTAERTEEIADRDAGDLLVDLYRSEVARLAVLTDAIDRDLSSGLYGRGGKLKVLAELRLRYSKRLEQVTEKYAEAMAARDRLADDAEDNHTTAESDLLRLVASYQHVSLITDVTPEDFLPDHYLQAFVDTTDPSVSMSVRRRSNRLLEKRRAPVPSVCRCYPEGPKLAEAKFNQRVELCRTDATEDRDIQLEGAIRLFEVGSTPTPAQCFKRTRAAFNDIIEAAQDEAKGKSLGRRGSIAPAHQRNHDPYWATALSGDRSVSAADRLSAFEGLDHAGALRRCSCPDPPNPFLDEYKADLHVAHFFYLLLQEDQEGAFAQGVLPRTYRALMSAREAARSGSNAATLP
jgi:hypothetical protein